MITLDQDARGVWDDIPHEEYVTDPVEGGSLSSTGARYLLPPSCPAKYRYYRDHPQVKPQWDFGHGAHLEVLGQGAPVTIIQRTDTKTGERSDADDMKTPSARAHAKEIRDAGGTPLLRADYDKVRAMAAALRTNPLCMAMLSDACGRSEVTLIVRDPEFGIMLRARVDFLRSVGRLRGVDYKTTTNAALDALGRQMHGYGYHVQAAFYLHVMRLLGLANEHSRFAFIAQEKEAPYLPNVYQPSGSALEAGMRQVRKAMEIYRDCSASGIWPGYMDGLTEIPELDLPRYAEMED